MNLIAWWTKSFFTYFLPFYCIHHANFLLKLQASCQLNLKIRSTKIQFLKIPSAKSCRTKSRRTQNPSVQNPFAEKKFKCTTIFLRYKGFHTDGILSHGFCANGILSDRILRMRPNVAFSLYAFSEWNPESNFSKNATCRLFLGCGTVLVLKFLMGSRHENLLARFISLIVLKVLFLNPFPFFPFHLRKCGKNVEWHKTATKKVRF